MINRHMQFFEEGGMTVLHGSGRAPLYTNQVKGLTDRYSNRNIKINLKEILPNLNQPQHNPYKFPFRRENGSQPPSSPTTPQIIHIPPPSPPTNSQNGPRISPTSPLTNILHLASERFFRRRDGVLVYAPHRRRPLTRPNNEAT